MLLVFDLDGTLIDSRADLVASVNATLAHLGRPALPPALVAQYVGDGAALLVQRALGLAPPSDPAGEPASPALLSAADQLLADAALEFFLRYYAKHKLDWTTLYPGVSAGLEALAAAGFTLAVLTNKPVRPSRDIVAHLGIAGYFCAVHGGNSFAQKKPDPVGLRAILDQCRLPASSAVMIGDSAVDVRTGRNAGAFTCGVSYGFAPLSLQREPPDWTVDQFSQLPPLFARLRSSLGSGLELGQGVAK